MSTKKREASAGEPAGSTPTVKKAKSFSIDSIISDMDNTMDELSSGK